jgi:trk system potassium uptake protein TrkH
MRHSADAWVLGPLMVAITVGGLGFPVISEWWANRRNPGAKWSIHATLTVWGSLGLTVLGALGIGWAESGNPKTLGPLPWPEQILTVLFTSVAARTAGFNALDVGAFNAETLFLHCVLMFVGGGSAGTAGGIKVTTTLVIGLVVWSEIKGRRDVEFRGRRISTSVQRQALSVVVLSAVAVAVGTLAVVSLTPFALDKVLFEVVSAFATVGLSTGITADLPPSAQLVVVWLMFAGRVGVVTLALALATHQTARAFRYPEEKPIVG